MKMKLKRPAGFPKKLSEGNAEVTIYWQRNHSRRLNPATGKWTAKTGEQFEEFVLAYYDGFREVIASVANQVKKLPKLVRQKFSTYAAAEKQARFVLVRLANLDGEALKIIGADRHAYLDALQTLHAWRPEARLGLAVADYVAAMKRLPEQVTLGDCVTQFLKRHPSGLPRKTVREVLDELIEAKRIAKRSDDYLRDLRNRAGKFASAFAMPIGTIGGGEVDAWLNGLGVGPCSRNNYLRLITTLFNFARARGYLPKDHAELEAIEWSDDSDGEIQIFTPAELKKLFGACAKTVTERKKERNRKILIPAVAIAAFAGLRTAEIKRLDWSEVHLTGSEKFIELKASKAKTASRRLVPVVDNLAAWLLPYAQVSGPVVPYERLDKQLFERIGPLAGVEWKRNALRHSFISYRLAIVKDVGEVALEAGNSASMIFKHYRQLVTETAAKEWFAILPPKGVGADIIPMPSATDEAHPAQPAESQAVVAAAAARV